PLDLLLTERSFFPEVRNFPDPSVDLSCLPLGLGVTSCLPATESTRTQLARARESPPRLHHHHHPHHPPASALNSLHPPHPTPTDLHSRHNSSVNLSLKNRYTSRSLRKQPVDHGFFPWPLRLPRLPRRCLADAQLAGPLQPRLLRPRCPSADQTGRRRRQAPERRHHL
uniref:Uncharacterized protein n=1 Tax=Aegilops tauschii subsp. strangulata TaxID=200361 RepID=A0A453S5N0_AEGTS